MKAAIFSLQSVSSQWLEKALKKYFKVVDSINLKEVEVHLTSKQAEILHNGKPIAEYDCIYLRGSFRYANLLRSITVALWGKAYLPLKADAFHIGHDKLLTQLVLQKHKIPMPTTYVSSGVGAAKKILGNINYPIIMKLPTGTQGKGVVYAESLAAASSMLDTLETLKAPFIIQEYVETGGIDTRAIVVGDKVVGAMKRKSKGGEKRANIHAGGKGESHSLDFHTKKMAIESAKAIGAEICAVDILESVKGPVVIEVNLSPGLQGITKATGVDVAAETAKYLAKKTKEYIANKKKKESDTIFEETGIKIDNGKAKQIITNVDMRGNRILLPEIVSKVTKFGENQQILMKSKKGKLILEKLDIEEEQ
jgi:ribosomal protein S6--L-glutamate ligase